jgi:myo-inositol 2-dehydrogenase / D-chiro-inositol 1-dehydrogenase
MTHPKRIIRLGIIGCGRVAEERHLPPIRHMPEVRVVATADLDPARSERLASRLGSAAGLKDYRSVLDRSDVDAVAILTPTASHAEIGIAALDAGKHVLVEKPLALSLAECDRFAARAAGSPCKVVVGFNLRWHRLVRRARELLATGALGKVKAIRSAYTHDRLGDAAPDWHRKLDLGGGVSFNEAVHHFDLWHYFGGGEVERIFSVSAPSRFYEDETSAVVARLTGGALATGVFTFRTGPTSEVEIYAELGRLCLSLYRFDGLEIFPVSKYPGDLGDRVRRTLASLGSLPQAVSGLRRGGEFQATFDGLWRHFIDCIVHDLPSQCTLEDGRKSVRVALAAVQSARSAMPVQLTPPEG